MATFHHQGLSLHFIDEGPREGPAILLIHGFASSLIKNWRETGWIETLTMAGFRVVALDNRGHGRSDKPHSAELYDDDAMAGDGLALLDHLGIARAALLGYSMGAMLALRLLSRAPQRWTRVILAGVGANALSSKPMTVIAEAMRVEDPSTITDKGALGFRVFAQRQDNDLLALAACAERPRHGARLDDFNAAQMPPVLVLVGEKDEIAGGPERLVAVVPGAVLALVPRRDHMTAVGDKETKRLALEFLAGLA